MMTLGILVLLLACTQRANGCQGFVFKVTKITSCARNSIIIADSASWAVIKDDCSMKGHVCLKIKGEIARAQVELEVNQLLFGFPITVYSDKFDSCNPPSEWAFIISILGFPGTCPFPAGVTCTDLNQIVNIPFSKSTMALLNNDFSIKLTAKAGQVQLTCVEIHLHKASSRTRASILFDYLDSIYEMLKDSDEINSIGMGNEDMSQVGMTSIARERPTASRISKWNPVFRI